MNKKEAMEYLGKKERQLANYVSSGRLPVDYISVKGVRTADYKQEDVAKLKAELDAESRPATVATATHARQIATNADGSSTQRVPAPANAIARVQPSLQVGQGSAESFSEMLTQSLTESLKTVAASDPASLVSKMLLTIPEAMSLSGIKEKPLRDAIKAGQLKSVRIGRSVQVRPADLQKWVDSQFS